MRPKGGKEMTQYAFFFDQSRCYGCKTCTVACKNWNDLEPGPEKWLRIFEWETGKFPEPRLHTLFVPCFHCEEPKCLDVCPSGAIYKEGKYGAVIVESDKCQDDGPCDRLCWDACPYGAPQFASDDPTAKMSKCNMCIDRLEKGELPVCVASCPVRALDFGPLEELEAKYGSLKDLNGLPESSETNPSVVFKPERLREKLVPYDSEHALRLFAERGDLPPLYADPAQVTNCPPGLVGRDHIDLKPDNVEELMRLTRNDEG